MLARWRALRNAARRPGPRPEVPRTWLPAEGLSALSPRGEEGGDPNVNPSVMVNEGLERRTALMQKGGRGMTAAQLEYLRVDEPAEVLVWRFDVLCRSGYDRDAAAVLAANVGVDLHAAVDLVQRGCPPKLAARILL